MKITEEMKRNMVRDSNGNWTAKGFTEFVESTKLGGSNRGMAAARGFLRGSGRSKTSPAQVKADIIASAITLGMSEAEATAFYNQGHKRS